MKFSKLLTILIATFPILSIYSSGVSSLSIADALLAVSLCVIVLRSLHERKQFPLNGVTCIALLLLYIAVTLPFQLIAETDVGLLSTLRFILYLMVLILGKDFFDFDTGIRVIGFLTVTVSAYVILQYLFFRITGGSLPWRFPFAKVIDESFVLKESSVYYYQFYRPTGIFYEPTHYAQYCLIYFNYLLFGETSASKTKWPFLLTITLGIVCSGAAAGFLMIVFSFGIYLLILLSQRQVNRNLIILLAFLAIGLMVLLNSTELAKVFTKLFNADGSMSSSVTNRFGSINQVFAPDKSALALLFGTGRGSMGNTYFTAIFYMLYCHGIVGLLIYLLIFANYFVRFRTAFQKSTLCVVFLMSIGSEMMVNFGILTYLIYLICFPTDRSTNRGRIRAG